MISPTAAQIAGAKSLREAQSAPQGRTVALTALALPHSRGARRMGLNARDSVDSCVTDFVRDQLSGRLRSRACCTGRCATVR